MLRLVLLYVGHQQRRTRVCAADGCMAEVIELLQVSKSYLYVNFGSIIVIIIIDITITITMIITIIVIITITINNCEFYASNELTLTNTLTLI